MTRRNKQDWELWERVKKTAKPLLRGQAVPEDFEALFAKKEKRENIGQKPKTSSRTVRPAPTRHEPKIQISLASGAARLDQPTAKKIAKGKLPIEARIDLHGMTQDQAYGRLLRFVESEHRRGVRTVLVITGKGSIGGGVLRQAVPRWLSEPNFRQFVIGHHESHKSHGGSGAIYVRLKKMAKTGNR